MVQNDAESVPDNRKLTRAILPKKKGGFRWDDVRIFYDDLNTMMMEIMMMTKYDDDERVGERIRGRRNWPDSGAAGEAEGIWRRPRLGRRINKKESKS